MAKMIYYYYNRDFPSTVVAFTVDKKYITDDHFQGLPVVPFEEVENRYPTSEYEIFVAIGPSKMNDNRVKKVVEAREKGYTLAKYISPFAICGSEVGENTFVGDMAIINPFVEIGENNMFWEHVFIGNDCVIGNNCFISPKTIVSTFSRVEDNVVLGSGSIVKTSVKVAKKSLVGAASFVSDDTKENGVYGEKSSPLYGCISDKINISSIKK